MDPTFAEGVKGYVVEAGKKAGEVGKTANQWGKAQLGVDVAEQVGGIYGTIKDNVVGNNPGGGYDPVHSGGFEDGRLYDGGDDDEDFFQANGGDYGHGQSTSEYSKKDDWGKEDDWDKAGWGKEDEWKSF